MVVAALIAGVPAFLELGCLLSVVAAFAVRGASRGGVATGGSGGDYLVTGGGGGGGGGGVGVTIGGTW